VEVGLTPLCIDRRHLGYNDEVDAAEELESPADDNGEALDNSLKLCFRQFILYIVD